MGMDGCATRSRSIGFTRLCLCHGPGKGPCDQTPSCASLDDYKFAGYDFKWHHVSPCIDGPRNRCRQSSHPKCRMRRHLHQSRLRRQHGRRLDLPAQRHHPTTLRPWQTGRLVQSHLQRRSRENERVFNIAASMKTFRSPKHPCLEDPGWWKGYARFHCGD